ncbi:caspase family protein [Streptomyces sp. N50]|uniref:HD domain-containing protein n=1 Tax=Streptomyces sp. N50 TaxID=3081765 RepID=UPI0029622D97|nr:caspase family protein [Streptomyces sp. N50]WOX08984.1 caspase family protein [Streptomyces sp. N50]
MEPGQHTEAVGTRRALLIGVKDTPFLAEHGDLADRYPPLASAETDVALVRDALLGSGYLIETECEKTGRGPVLGRVSHFFERCAPGDTAFLYISCHGETIRGRDHLVLSDSQPGRMFDDGSPGLLASTLLKADASELLSSLPPSVDAIVCLDTCRTSQPDHTGAPETVLVPGGRNAYLLYSCGPGQRSYTDPVEGSWFARALAKALSRDTPPTTFYDVVQYTNTQLRETAQAYPHIAPPTALDLRPLAPQGAAQLPNPVICEGSRLTTEWIRAIRESELWRHTSGEAGVHEQITRRLEQLVESVADSCLGTGAHRADPWRDPRYPIRVENRLSDLVRRASLRADEQLSPAETACLLAATVVYEGAVATGLEDLRAQLPTHFDPGPRGRDSSRNDHDHRSLVRDAARDVCRAYGLVLRTTETLHRRGFKEEAVAADHWLRHRFIADWDPLWERDSVYTPVHELIRGTVEAIEAAAETPAAGPRTEEARQEIDRRVRQVIGHLTVKPGTSPRINDSRHSDTWDDGRDWRPVRGNRWRGPQLARLLWTAGLLAADPRRLSSVLVDHLGAREPLKPAETVEALGTGLDYDEDEGPTQETHSLAIRFDCAHPALHAALEELVAAADATVRAFRQDSATQPLLRGLPARVTTGQLHALGGRYAEPLERFRLAEDEIRPLLMGTQLYGDRMLAVRELYQNALDACRVRNMRRQYDGKAPWPGRIVFTQGMDGMRPYIQCADDGAGMNRAKLTSMFARAGRRYEQDPDFVLERRNWRRAKLPHQPMNSRFGIGVFSYFMLADEVVVWTNPVDQRGRADSERLRADIQSGSGLLRINTTDDGEVPESGGTVVRLYLAEPRENEKRPSLVHTLRELLWVTEQEVSAHELAEDGQVLREYRWTPDTLEPRDRWQNTPMRAGEDAWLVQGEGQFLLDGVVIPDAPELYGQVLNLRERHSPVPSVNRNQLLEYDDRLALQELLNGVPQAVAGCEEVSLRWLWELAREAPQVAVAVLDALPVETVAVLGASDYDERLGKERLLLRDVGCFPCDALVMHTAFRRQSLDDSRPYEGILFESWQFTRLGIRQQESSFAPAGYPAPAGLDALLFQQDAPWGWVTVLQAAAQSERSVREALRAVRRYAIAGVIVPEAEDICRLGDIRPSRPAADLYAAYKGMSEWTRRFTEDTFGSFRTRRRRSDHLRTDGAPAPHTPLLAISALHDLPLGEVADLLPELRLVDPAIPPPPVLDVTLAAERATQDDLRRFAYSDTPASSPWELRPNWLPGTVRPVDLLSRAEPSCPLQDLVEHIERLAPLGLTLEQPPTAQAQQTDTLPADQRLLLSGEHNRTAPWYEGILNMHDILHISVKLQQPLGDLARRIMAATAVTGIIVPDIPDKAADWLVPDWLVPDWLASAPEAAEQSRRLFRPWEIVGLFHYNGHKMDELPQAVRALGSCGLIDWGTADAKALERQAMGRHHLLTAYPNGLALPSPTYTDIGGDFDEDGVSLAFLLGLTTTEGADLATVMSELSELSTDLPLAIDQPPPETLHLRATAIDVYILMQEQGATRFRDRLTLSDLLEHADFSRLPLATSVKQLAVFIPLGAPAPPGDFRDPEVEALTDFFPDRFDHAAFDKGLLGPGVLGPLELVLVAGRFGWTLGETYQRYAPLRCLGLEVTVTPPDGDTEALTPDWRDVVLLTEHLTGRAPALSGTVTSDHISLCAEETDLDEAQVTERLHRYAGLFGLRLPPPRIPSARLSREDARP